MIKLEKLYLVSGEIKDGQVVPGSVVPLTNKHIAIPGADEKQVEYAKTDKHGMIKLFSSEVPDTPTPHWSIPTGNRFVQFVNKELVETCIVCKNPDEPEDGSVTSLWKKQLSTVLNDEEVQKKILYWF